MSHYLFSVNHDYSKPLFPEGTDLAPMFAAVDAFNKEIAAVNEKMAVFNVCLKSYVDNGNADMRRIKQRLDAAIAAANGP